MADSMSETKRLDGSPHFAAGVECTAMYLQPPSSTHAASTTHSMIFATPRADHVDAQAAMHQRGVAVHRPKSCR